MERDVNGLNARDSETGPPRYQKDSRQGWSVIGAAFIGMLLSVGVLVLYSFGVLTSSMSKEFEWTGVERSTLFLAFSLSSTIAGPVWGGIADRIGSHRVALVSSGLLCLGFVCLGIVHNSLLLTQLLFAFLGIFGSGTLPAVYSSVVVGWFDRHRGLALGITMTGVGAGAAIIPSVAAAIDAAANWRWICFSFAGMIAVFSIPAAGLFLREYPKDKDLGAASVSANWRTVVAGVLTQTRTYILALYAFVLGAIVIAGVTNFVPLLQSRGLTLTEAASYQSLLGVSLIAGRLITGALIDRIFAPYVMTAILCVTAAGFGILSQANSPVAFVIAAVGIGLAIGGEIDFLGYMVSRYFNRAMFTTIFAFLFAIHSLGASGGPVLFGWLVECSGGYSLPLLSAAGLSLFLAGLMLALPGYAKIESRDHQHDKRERDA